MKKETDNTQRFHTAVRTKHVFTEGDQVFLKIEPEAFIEDTTVAEWFPTNFKWEPARL